MSHSLPEPVSQASPPGLEPAPPAALLPESFAGLLYAMLAPLAREDFDNGWSLLIYCNALGQMFQLVEELVRDTPAGPGWSLLLDLDRCPADALPWLAQFVGVRLPPGLSEAEQRAWIASTGGFRRGTRAAMVGAAAATLTGTKAVLFTERSGDPSLSPEYAYFLTVHTYTDETPSPETTYAALVAAKPAGLVLEYVVSAGQLWQQLKDSGRTWAQVKTTWASWDDVRTDKPIS